jgi:chemotaxis protein methyltransferase CheR
MAVRILGTDVDPHLVERARAGCYRPGTLKELPGPWQESCFDRVDGARCVRPLFREGIDFAVEDVRLAMPDGPFDLVSCRNLVFTYFEETLQRQLGGQIEERLFPGGALVIGHHETLPEGLFAPWHPFSGIHRKRDR